MSVAERERVERLERTKVDPTEMISAEIEEREARRAADDRVDRIVAQAGMREAERFLVLADALERGARVPSPTEAVRDRPTAEGEVEAWGVGDLPEVEHGGLLERERDEVLRKRSERGIVDRAATEPELAEAREGDGGPIDLFVGSDGDQRHPADIRVVCMELLFCRTKQTRRRASLEK